MTIALTGGGSGGHITPLSAIAAEIKKQSPDSRIVYIGQKGDRFGNKLAADPSIGESTFVSAGKFRRYHGSFGWLIEPRTLALNVRDFFRFMTGIYQSLRLLRKLAPDAVFIKGGFVGVPVGLAAAICHVPFVTHDSDAVPGLANRIVGRWARVNAVAMQGVEYTNYSKPKIITTGIPVNDAYKKVNKAEQLQARGRVGLEKFDQVVLITGGGLGAKRLNEMLLAIVPNLLDKYENLAIVHQAGETHLQEVEANYEIIIGDNDVGRVVTLGYCSEMYDYSAAADVIITRAGATTIAELSIQQKPIVVVPNPKLTGGHQIVNANVLDKQHAALVVPEGKHNEKELEQAVELLLDDKGKAKQVAENLARLAAPESARKLAEVVLGIADSTRHNN